jgi:hypothetical protein
MCEMQISYIGGCFSIRYDVKGAFKIIDPPDEFLHDKNRCPPMLFTDLPFVLHHDDSDVFSNAEHFDLPLRFLLKTFYKSNSKHSTQKQT